MACMGPNLDHSRRLAAEAWQKVEPILLGYGLTVDPPNCAGVVPKPFRYMTCRQELEAVRKAIEELFVADACNTF